MADINYKTAHEEIQKIKRKQAKLNKEFDADKVSLNEFQKRWKALEQNHLWPYQSIALVLNNKDKYHWTRNTISRKDAWRLTR